MHGLRCRLGTQTQNKQIWGLWTPQTETLWTRILLRASDLDSGVPQTRLRSLAGCAERREVCHPQRAFQRRDEQRELPGDQEQVSGATVQGRWSRPAVACLVVCLSVLPVCYTSWMLSVVVRAGAGDRGAAAQGSLFEYDRGSSSPLHGPQHSLQWGGVSGRVPPAPEQGVHVWKQACQCSSTQR